MPEDDHPPGPLLDLARAPAASSPAVRDRFRRQGRRDTAPELAVRRRLHDRGVRYRVDVRPGRATRARGDVVWKGRRLVVFIDGCFWHACPTCGHLPRANAGWWAAKLAANAARDSRTDQVLRAEGWRVLRFWEHEDPDRVVEVICRALSLVTEPVASIRSCNDSPGSGDRVTVPWHGALTGSDGAGPGTGWGQG